MDVYLFLIWRGGGLGSISTRTLHTTSLQKQDATLLRLPVGYRSAGVGTIGTLIKQGSADIPEIAK